jgi:hypothetical protein
MKSKGSGPPSLVHQNTNNDVPQREYYQTYKCIIFKSGDIIALALGFSICYYPFFPFHYPNTQCTSQCKPHQHPLSTSMGHLNFQTFIIKIPLPRLNLLFKCSIQVQNRPFPNHFSDHETMVLSQGWT